MNQILSSIDRQSLIKAVAIGLIIYAVLNVCIGIVAMIGGGILGTFGASTATMLQETGVDSLDAEARAAVAQAATMGGFVFVLGILYIISVPIFAGVSWGLFQRKSWARMGAVIALGIVILFSILSFDGFMDLLWLVVAGFVLYIFLTDAEIKAEFGR